MANLKLYPNGITAGIPGKAPTNGNTRRGDVGGWSRDSVRSLLRLLYALDLCDVLTAGHLCRPYSLVSFSLTVRDVPPTPDHWRRLRESFFRALRRCGVTQVIWLTEWQARGAPHLHGIVVLPAGTTVANFLALWVRVAAPFRASHGGQDAKPIYDALGWCEYLGKHSARGVHHYQRNRRNIPASWQGKTGRMWGRLGSWTIRDPVPVSCDHRSFFRLRRVLRGKAISEARSRLARRDCRENRRSLSFCRRSLSSPDPILSRLRGVSQFLPHDQALAILEGIDAWLTWGEEEC